MKIENVGDTDDMAKNALKLLKDDEKLKLFKRQALERAKEFSIDKILPMYVKLYESVVEDNG